MKTILLMWALVGAVATTELVAQQRAMPPGKWWRRPEVAQRLQLSAEQQNRLDAVARETARTLIDLKAEVDKRELDMREELDSSQLDRARIQRAATALSDARGRLFERELMLMVDMRGVLSSEQWSQLRGLMSDRRPSNPNPRVPQRRRP